MMKRRFIVTGIDEKLGRTERQNVPFLVKVCKRL
jgi:hypothetical protein